MENGPFEDVFPIVNGDIPMLRYFTGGYIPGSDRKKIFFKASMISSWSPTVGFPKVSIYETVRPLDLWTAAASLRVARGRGDTAMNGMVLSMFFVFDLFSCVLVNGAKIKSCFIQDLNNLKEEESYHESLEIGDGVKI